jgi:hypothetical protein
MNPDLQAELRQRYPNFLRRPGKRLLDPNVCSGLKSCLVDDWSPFDERGIECGVGWFALVERLCRACEVEIETLMLQGNPEEGWPRVAQIKEKLGGLRFYVHGPLSEELRRQILQAELEESYCICEQCSAQGKLREGQWMRTLCKHCG